MRSSTTGTFALLFLLLAGFWATPAQGQSMLNPADPVRNYDPASPPAEPAWGEIGKWVRTPKLFWNTDAYKAYFYKGNAFRLRFPKTYNPAAADGKKYPMLVFFHGIGEKGPIHDNEYHLYHGGEVFNNAVNSGAFDGYVLFMQSPGGFFGGAHYQNIAELIDYMVANNKLDPFRVSVNGLSGGGQASWEMLINKPAYIAASLPMSWTQTEYKQPAVVNTVKHTPLWIFQGGQDGSPAPSTSEQVRDAILGAGGNFRYTVYPELGHGTWDKAWSEPDFFPFLTRAYAANPWPHFGRTEFCPGDAINVTLGLNPGFGAYQWRRNGIVIEGAVTNTLQVTQTGLYEARVSRNGVWSEWSRIPVEIRIKAPTLSPAIAVSGTASRVLPAADGSTGVRLEVPEGYTSYDWQQEGNPATLSTTRFFTATAPGNYKVRVTEQFGCSSEFSPLFTVVDANGPNKPDAATNLTANVVSKTALRLDWSDNPAPSFNETGFEIYQGTRPGGPYRMLAMAGPNARTYTVTGLNPAATYYYRVRAVNNTAAAALSNEASATTISDVQPPTPPRNLAINGITRNSLTLTWLPATDDVAVTQYEIFINGQKAYVTADTRFIVSGLESTKSYNITVRARDFAGNTSPHSNQVTGLPSLNGLNYKYYTYTGSWEALPDFNRLTPVKTGITPNISLDLRTQDDNYAFLWEGYINVPVTGTYQFRTNSDDGSRLYLGALNGTGSPYSYTGTPLVNNDGLHARRDVTSEPVNLVAGIYPFAVSFYEGTQGEGISVTWSHPQTGFTFVPMPNQAFMETAPAGPMLPPAKPSDLTATGVAYKRVNLQWTDNSTNETGFELWRSTSPLTNFTTIGQVPANTTTYSDTMVNPNTRYYYRVRALGQYGESGFDKAGQGVDYTYYEQTGLSALPDFSKLTPRHTGRMTNFGLGMQERPDNFVVKFSGVINIPATDVYTFYTNSDDGSKLYIDGFDEAHLVVNNDGWHAPQERYGTVNLTAGPHTIFVTFFESGGGEELSVKISAPSLPKQAIPDYFLGLPNTSAVTPVPPATPLVPAALLATGTSTATVQLTWTDRSAGEQKFEVFRSAGNRTGYVQYATVPANTTTFTDTALFANAIYYYKVRAVGAGGNSGFSNEDSAKTGNHLPELQALENRSARYGVVTTIPVTATDVDGEALQFRGENLPPFASLAANGSRAAVLTLQPTAAQQGVYPNIRLIVSDQNGGADTAVFSLTVNDNFDPVISPVAGQTVNENSQVSLALSATDGNPGDVLTWSVSNAPESFTLTPNADRTATLLIKPGYATAGTYTVSVQVRDNRGGVSAPQQFNLTVVDQHPTNRIYVRMMSRTPAGAPWNSATGGVTTNLQDAAGQPTGVGLTLQPWWVHHEGPLTGNNSGVYPDAVLRDYYYFGTGWTPQTVNGVLTGLNPALRYNLTFYGGGTRDITFTDGRITDQGTTIYSAGGQSAALYVHNNTQNTVSLYNLQPAANGTLTFNMAKGANTPVGYLNALVITPLYDDGTLPVTPDALTAQNSAGKGVQLSWRDLAYNESAYEVYRAAAGAATFALVGTVPADATSFADSTVAGNTAYQYRVRAVNLRGASGYAATASVVSWNRVPQLTPVGNIVVKNNQALVVPVTATDDAADRVRLTASGLPSFVSFTDNGNGTGSLRVQPAAGSVGTYNNITLSATDNSDSTRTTTFSITVVDKNLLSVYLNFTEWGYNADKPWNNLNTWPVPGTSFTGLLDENGQPSGLTLSFPNGFGGVGGRTIVGARPGNGRELYPPAVMRTGEWESAATARPIVVSGLSTARKYNFVFFNSSDRGFNTTTQFTINGQTVSLNAAYNVNKTVQINGIVPDASGQVTISVVKAAGADYAVLSALVIQSYDPAQVTLMGPADLRVVDNKMGAVTLQWQDRADSETGYEVWRAPAGSTSYALLTTTAPNTTGYTDGGLAPGKTYHYVVRAARDALRSDYSNPATGYTYAGTVHMNFSHVHAAPAPWNNANTPPQVGYVWPNLVDHSGTPSSISLVETGLWAGIYDAGMTTGNNSGVVPDNVMLESYGLFPGQSATLKVTGLQVGMKYDFTFFASSQSREDVTVAYTVNQRTVYLNAAQNRTGTVTLYGVVADANGDAWITVAPGTPESQFGLIGGLIIQGYYPETAAPAVPLSAARLQSAGVPVTVPASEAVQALRVYPNPFTQSFVLTLPALEKDKVEVGIYDADGRVVYRKQFTGLVHGANHLRVQTPGSLPPGVYILKAVWADRRQVQQVKVIRQ